MRVENLEQGSPEWHEHRSKYRNASIAGGVMGDNPYQTRRQTWEQKHGIGEPFTGNAATRYGNKWEAKALQVVSDFLDVKLEPAVFVEGEYSASFDAYGEVDGKTFMVEIKCPHGRYGSTLWEHAKSDGMNRIPKIYYWQMVHQEICQPCTHRYFFVYIPAIDDEEEDWELIPFHTQQGDAEKLKEAWDDFETNEPDPDYVIRTDGEFKSLMNTHKTQMERKKAIEAEIKTSVLRIKEACEGKSTKGFGSTVSMFSKKGNVNYKKIPELQGVDLESYRAKVSDQMRITHAKD